MNASTRVALASLLWLSAGAPAGAEMPWREAGWSAAEAAAHLLSRFAYGPRPGEVARVAADPEGWFEAQLAAASPEPVLEARLGRFRALDLPVEEYPRRYPGVGSLVREAQEAGVLPAELGPDAGREGLGALRGQVLAFARERGYRGLHELLGELAAQKVLRAVYAENQLAEVMTDFWFNHFNVSLEDALARPYVLAYERDALRPRALGRFRDLLGATARHPAMLFYLDNAQSTAAAGERALNENYARELLELHTLGADGGFTQQDVVETARAFSGWTVAAPGDGPEGVAAMASGPAAERAGSVHEGGFVFRPGAHDAGAKTVLGRRLPPGRGTEDGEEVLDLLARHPATARHLAAEIAVRFVSDDPPEALVERLAAVWSRSDGDLREVLRALVAAPEFWDRETRAAKIKSPFELAISAVRALGAEVSRPRELVEWVRRMGQPLYAYPAPSGYPDRAAQWVNAGALLNRMSFALTLAAGRVDGVLVDLDRLIGPREPESRAAALESLWGVLLPARPLGEVEDTLSALIEARGLAGRLEEAAPPPADRTRRRRAPEPSALDQVAGVILGSPEFQRR